MKEELIKFLEEREILGYRLDPAPEYLVREGIDEFFSQYQPERSKREDDIMYLKCRCGEYKHVFLDELHMSRCGALNSTVT